MSSTSRPKSEVTDAKASLPAVRWDRARAQALGARLAERVGRSAQAHRDYRTTRQADLQWAEQAPGVAQALLHAGEQAHATLVRLQPGAQLPWPEGTHAQEVLVVQGLVHAQPAQQAATVLERHALVLRSSADAGAVFAPPGGPANAAPALLYVRQVRAPTAQLPGAEGRWWAVPRAPFQTVAAVGRRWRPNFPGVEVLPLWGTAEITSMLVRFAPGAGVPDHHHAADEDCLMLEGEMFLGDVLLQPGDYQLAPAGGGHFGESSDVGCTFFFHGAIDPVLVPAARG